MKRSLVLSGGGAKGSFQYGAIRYLWDEGCDFDHIYGVSVGSLNGAMVAQGDVEKLGHLWASISNEKVYTGGLKLWSLVKVLFGQRSFYSNKPLQGMISEYIDPRRMKVPFRAGTVEMCTGAWRLWDVNNMDVYAARKAILASTAIPIIWEPVYLQGEQVDGGVRTQTPLMAAMEDGADEIIVVLCNPEVGITQTNRNKLKDVLGIAERTVDILSNEIAVEEVQQALRINRMVIQAEEHGVALYNRKGRLYKYIPIKLIAPEYPLQDALDFSHERVVKSINYGRYMAKQVMG